MFSIPLFAYGKRFFSFTLHKDFRSHRSRFRLRYCKGLWILHRLHLLLQLMPHRTFSFFGRIPGRRQIQFRMNKPCQKRCGKTCILPEFRYSAYFFR